ncbi:hypothetical protein [Erwinia pyrifoliae]|nr:Glucosyltransferase-I precursor [Erwinia pyrifoliae DSM 12163]
MTDTVGSSGSVNNHTDPYHRSINAHRHARANQPKPQTFTTTVTESGISKKRLFDFSCAKEREILSFSDVLRNIADTLSSPAKKMGEEWQIVYDYSLLKVGCPKASEKMFLLNILHYVDAVSETILHSFPEFIPLMILQNIAPPVLKTIADKLEGKKISFDVIIEVNKELLSVFQMLSASLDAHGINLLSKERDGRPGGIIPEKLKIEKGAVIVEVNGGEFKMNRDSYGVYIYELEQKSLALRKQYINYLRDKKIWVHQKNSVILSPVNPGDESVFEVSRKILNASTNVAKNVGKDISSVNFITAVLARSGWVEGESLELMRGNSERLNLIINHIENKVSIKDTNQLLHLKSGQVVVFTQNKGSEVEAKYAMLAAGNGLFTGVHNEIFSGEFACEDITLTAEQLGGFEGGSLLSIKGEMFQVSAGFVKNTQLPFYKSYKDSVLNLGKEAYSEGNAHAIAVVLSRTGDIPPDLVSALHSEMLNKGSVRQYIKGKKGWLNGEDIASNIPPGGMIFLTQKPGESYEDGIFSLRLNEDEFFIPELLEPALKVGGAGTIYKLAELKGNIKEKNLWVKPVAFDLEKTRVQALLGRDSRFYIFGDSLRIRAHGGPNSINYKSPSEIVSIIRGLAISKDIDLNRINSIEIESCFGATGFPSSGRIISAKMGKKVVAWRGKYRTGHDAANKDRVVYFPTPLNHLENISAEIFERNISFINKIKAIYFYLVNTIFEPSPLIAPRIKRNSRYFNLFLLDLGKLVLGKTDTENFIKNNEFFYGLRDGDKAIIRDEILIYKPKNSQDFFELCMEVLFVSPEASEYLDSYISKALNDDNFSLTLQSTSPDKSCIDADFIKKINTTELLDLAYVLGISSENMYLSPKEWHEFGFVGDIFINTERNTFFELRKEGIPSSHFWHYPDDALNDENWLYAGRHPGTLAQPKDWYEYGKTGSVFYAEKQGYFSLKTDGRPSDLQWYFPMNAQSDKHWEFITREAGTFKTPRKWNDNGDAGDVYFLADSESFYILRKEGNPPSQGWLFPIGKTDNAYWIYAGNNQGTLDSPKHWNEYGKAGSVYYEDKNGYFSLKADGNPLSNNWSYPNVGHSNEHWNFICYEVGSFKAPKLPGVEGSAGEVYYSTEKKLYYILRKDGKPARHGWHFPPDKTDDENWIYGGENAGTAEFPKNWGEYGKAGSVYHQPGYGYFSLKTEGRPSENKWKFPNGGKSNKHWKLISWEQGSFNAPRQPDTPGRAGEVYYSHKYQLFYILRASGNPSLQNWPFPANGQDDENWICAGKNRGTPQSPKALNEYGKAGSLYYQPGYGYLALKTEGRPSSSQWNLPNGGQSDKHWKFISFDRGSFIAPKNRNLQGKAGEVYFSVETESFYILRNEITDSANSWSFPSGKEDNANWFYAGENRGTLDSPKAWNEYGKVGSVYYQAEYGYLTLKKEGRPSKYNWSFPHPGKSNDYWKFISLKMGSFIAPKHLYEEGIAGEVYHSDKNQPFYILKKAGKPSIEGWQFPPDEEDNANWICAGVNRGTPDSPKAWTDYGKVGSVYYQPEYGYLTLKNDGRPSDYHWTLPSEGKSNEYWEFISHQSGSFSTPKCQNDKGTVGEIYYDDEKLSFYILKTEGTPSAAGWSFPHDKTDNARWIYGGENKGILHSPKAWGEYGKRGSVYHSFRHGYLILQTEGRPSDNKWYYPPDGQSDEHWQFISWEAGSWIAPKRQSDEGMAGEVYYSDKNSLFYILKKAGKPAKLGWYFPADRADNAYWIYAGDHKGTLQSPKKWNEYGKAGSVYYQPGYGFLTLKAEGRPPDNHWLFPAVGKSDGHWNFISFEAGSYTASKGLDDKGVAGEVYYSSASNLFYILRKEGIPSSNGWDFPSGKMDNWYWLYGGENRGTLANPKNWSEYGKVGSVYYIAGNGHFLLQTEGIPSVNKWYFPLNGGSNVHWLYIKR